MTLTTLGMGIVKYLKTKKSSPNLKKIHDKYFDKSGMKQKGKDIVKEGLKGLRKQPKGTFSTFPSEIVRTLKGKK